MRKALRHRGGRSPPNRRVRIRREKTDRREQLQPNFKQLQQYSTASQRKRHDPQRALAYSPRERVLDAFNTWTVFLTRILCYDFLRERFLELGRMAARLQPPKKDKFAYETIFAP